MLRHPNPCATMAGLSKSSLRFGRDGEGSLLVLELPFGSGIDGVHEVLAVPLVPRDGGLLLALPADAVKADAIALWNAAGDEDVFGPTKVLQTGLLGEDDNGQPMNLEVDGDFLVVDVTDGIFSAEPPILREYDASHDGVLDIRPFSSAFPESIPETVTLADAALKWAAGNEVPRVNFYSAREEQVSKVPVTKLKIAASKRVTNAALAEKVEQLAARLEAVASGVHVAPPQAGTPVTPANGPSTMFKATPKMPALSQGLHGIMNGDESGLGALSRTLGPPPRTRASPVPDAGSKLQELREEEPVQISQVGQDPVLQALMTQGSALTTLVAQLASQDPLDLGLHSSGSSSSQGTSTRGVQRREKMQQDLALGQSNYWMQFQQQLHRRMQPSRPVPRTDAEVKNNHVSFQAYLERFGGYKQNKELGTVAWILGQAVDAAAMDDFNRTKEILALLTCAIEQAVLDQSWQTAFLVSLAEDPPLAMFQDRLAAMGGSRPFSPLIPSSWAAVCLAYLKELEVLQSKKVEVDKPTKPAAKAAVPKSEDSPSPKRRPRYPRRPKADQPAPSST